MTEIIHYLQQLSRGEHLTHDQASRAFTLSLLGATTPSQTAGLYMAMAVQGINEEEYAGAIEAFCARSSFIKVPSKSLHIGHSGESLGGFWIAISVACILAALDVPVSGHIPFYNGHEIYNAEDILTHLGIVIPKSIEEAQKCFDEVSIGLVPLSIIHPRLRETIPIHRELKIHSPLYPILPFSYSTDALYHFVGLCNGSWVKTVGQYLIDQKKGHQGCVVAGMKGLEAYDLLHGTNTSYVKKDDVYCEPKIEFWCHSIDKLRWKGETDGLECAKKIRECVSGKGGREEETYFGYVHFHTAYILTLLEMDTNISEAYSRIKEIIQSRKALEKLNQWVEISTNYHMNYKR